jgi:hypothetical protein
MPSYQPGGMPGGMGTGPTGDGTTGQGMVGQTDGMGGGGATAGAFGGEQGRAVGGNYTATGYIDSAIPRTQFRLRYDSAYEDNRPDRADFFYPKCGCFRMPGTPTTDPNAPGPPKAERKIDYHELSSYLELAPDERLSGFVEIPIRYLDPEVNQHASGLGDIYFGFKYAILYNPDQVLTLQLKTFAPTGDAGRGLGTNNWRLEPALLYYRQCGRFALETELRDNIPVDSADDFAGNVLRYGVGVSYLAVDREHFRIQPVFEVVGWTVLSGKEFGPDIGIKDASGDTIVNAKIGARFGFGQLSNPGLLSQSDLYIGYGRALTGDVWYKDIVRVEFRMRF